MALLVFLPSPLITIMPGSSDHRVNGLLTFYNGKRKGLSPTNTHIGFQSFGVVCTANEVSRYSQSFRHYSIIQTSTVAFSAGLPAPQSTIRLRRE
ncbi:hypothetical protein K449DRAFT_23407 [Hypoxylon sp. EC38]|nr:hypothetical protein K449DRAFT_23407 [Hypoxylon sp. EC38]